MRNRHFLTHFDGRRPMGAVTVCGKTYRAGGPESARPYTPDAGKVTCEDCLDTEGFELWQLKATAL